MAKDDKQDKVKDKGKDKDKDKKLAVDDVAATDEDSPVGIDVLANDKGGNKSIAGLDLSATAGSATIEAGGGSVVYDPRGPLDILA